MILMKYADEWSNGRDVISKRDKQWMDGGSERGMIWVMMMRDMRGMCMSRQRLLCA
jgi:hypothetical protein